MTVRNALYLVGFGWLGVSAIVWLVYLPLLYTTGFNVGPLLSLLRIFHAFSLEWPSGPWSLAAAALVLALVVRRILAFRARRSLAPPDSFSGFAYGLVWLGLILLSAHLLARMLAPLLAAQFPSLYVVGFRFGPAWYTPWFILGLLMSELPTLRATAAPAPAQRRAPTFGALAMVFPLLGLLPVFLLDRIPGSGWAGLLLGFASILAGLTLGAIATAAAVLRKERLVPLQVLTAFVNFSGLGYFISIW